MRLSKKYHIHNLYTINIYLYSLKKLHIRFPQHQYNKKCQISFYMLCFQTAHEAYLLFISKAFSNICVAHILSHFSSTLRCRYWYSRNVFTICNFMTNNFTAKYAYYIQTTTGFTSYTTKKENLKLQLVSFLFRKKH